MNKKKKNSEPEISKCSHQNKKVDGGFIVCQDCGLILAENLSFEDSNGNISYFDDTQREYERKIKIRDSRAKQNPKIKQKYEKIKTLEKWFRDYESSFIQQKKTIDLLKGYEIGLNIDSVKMQEIKKRYLRYNRENKKIYQNMVIIFLAIVWMEIKDTTNIRLEEYIDVCNELGHKINKKMLNNAMLKVLKAEQKWNQKSISSKDLEKEIKKKIKILFQKNLNDIPFQEVKEHIYTKNDFNKLKIEMQLILDGLLKRISYDDLKNLNYKAFTSGLIYYIGQMLDEEYRKIFIQSKIEEITKFSTTTIRKKYHILIDLLGSPEKQEEFLKMS
ncbi:MAG: hypothetical protein GF317_09275 [Candidatus Lokiarchaeota archaeon]|nr:hypothetical protein [Candidatus Lokiarchaeota archaeon]MBD3199902.1 hypothetical protein [Candidatus Lokiarchaeota archaeon]